MRNLSITFCLVIVALFGSVGIGSATDLPKRVPGVTSSWAKTETWDNCKGVFFRQVGHRYEGEWVNGKLNGRGTETLRDNKSTQIKYKYVGEWQDNLWHVTEAKRRSLTCGVEFVYSQPDTSALLDQLNQTKAEVAAL